MKKIYFIVIGLFMATSVFSQHKESGNLIEKLLWDDNMLNIMVDTRIDAQAGIVNGDLNNLGFHGQTIKIWFVGEIIPGVRYRIRHRLNKPQTPLREGYSGATDQAWLAFDLGEHWTITAGKQSVQFGTFEYDYNPADIYLGSMAFNDLDAYKTGVDAALKFAGQTIHFQVVNSDATQFAHPDYANRALAAVAMWEGNLFDNLLKTRWGYAALQHNSDTFYNWVTLGTQLNIGDFTTELDYYWGERNMDYSSVVMENILGNRLVCDQSVSVNLKYNFGKWRPFIKGVWNQRHDKGFGSNAYESFGIQGVVEYYPFTHPWVKDLRFHLMYGYNSTDFQGVFNTTPSQNEHTILFGTRWLFKAK
ncbi:hypothetical protein D0T49_05380 [Paludibacter sp. 221]|uniref:porin n=1 Tax=Paludibacter sp. 221 TaxID=2302939 RepID=UPI0013D00F77|nr:porin [Paludibacter sp. 221]NDV46472.1 hypothetical protein [Paludibacter sp. 221]